MNFRKAAMMIFMYYTGGTKPLSSNDYQAVIDIINLIIKDVEQAREIKKSSSESFFSLSAECFNCIALILFKNKIKLNCELKQLNVKLFDNGGIYFEGSYTDSGKILYQSKFSEQSIEAAANWWLKFIPNKSDDAVKSFIEKFSEQISNCEKTIEGGITSVTISNKNGNSRYKISKVLLYAITGSKITIDNELIESLFNMQIDMKLYANGIVTCNNEVIYNENNLCIVESSKHSFLDHHYVILESSRFRIFEFDADKLNLNTKNIFEGDISQYSLKKFNISGVKKIYFRLDEFNMLDNSSFLSIGVVEIAEILCDLSKIFGFFKKDANLKYYEDPINAVRDFTFKATAVHLMWQDNPKMEVVEGFQERICQYQSYACRAKTINEDGFVVIHGKLLAANKKDILLLSNNRDIYLHKFDKFQSNSLYIANSEGKKILDKPTLKDQVFDKVKYISEFIYLPSGKKMDKTNFEYFMSKFRKLFEDYNNLSFIEQSTIFNQAIDALRKKIIPKESSVIMKFYKLIIKYDLGNENLQIHEDVKLLLDEGVISMIDCGSIMTSRFELKDIVYKHEIEKYSKLSV